MLKQWYKKFSAQPHQPFFANGLIFFMLFMLLLFASYSNVIVLKTTLLTFHAYALIFVVFIQFFLGFLFVVFPRFLMQATISSSVFMTQFFLYFIGTVCFFVGLVISTPLYLVAMAVLFVAQILSFNTLFGIYKKSIIADGTSKYDTKWILIGFATGIVAHFIFLVAQLNVNHAYLLEKFAVYVGFYLFLFMIIFTVSQRMIPFFTSMKVPEYTINKSSHLLEKLYGLLLLKVLVQSFAQPQWYIVADLPLFLFFTFELYKWKLPLFKTTSIMWVLFLGLYWIPVGFLLSSIESLCALFQVDFFFGKASLHVFALGYFVTVLLGFGTRVVLGHSGRVPYADKITTMIFLYIQLVVVVRVFASLSLNVHADYIFWINHTALLLILGLFVWSVKFLPILMIGHNPNH
ncbi:MAG: NnrS family protein [Candidatus Marinarcus sp.]|uniref:NnrS family protein n=1 Tax=Candidatus Marinarcus sp. TaxID=3100987 RepID=UPI003AFFF4B6